MSESKEEEIQAELFHEFSGQPQKAKRFPSLNKSPKPILISTSIEQLIFAGILLILALCLVFFLGVIRGKSLAVPPPRVVTPAPVSHMLAMPRYRPPVPKNQALPMQSKPSVSAPVKKPYMIQLVTYKRRDLAENEALAFRRRGMDAVVIPSGDYYQVCVGQYASKEEAKKDLKLFSVKYKDCFLRRR